MRSTFALVKQHLVEQRLSTVIWMVVLSLLSYMVVTMAPAITSDNFLFELIKNTPEHLSRLYGNLFAYKYPVDAFLQFKWMLFIPILTTIFGILAAMGAVARDIDNHTADFALTLPITRYHLLLARFLAIAISMAMLYFVSYIMLWLGLRILDTPASLMNYAYFYTGMFFITLTLAAFTLWLSVFVDEYAKAVRLGLVIGVSLWTFSLINRIAGGPLYLSRLSLFGWVETEPVIGRGIFPWGAVFVGLALTAGFLLLAVISFKRKQIS